MGAELDRGSALVVLDSDHLQRRVRADGLVLISNLENRDQPTDRRLPPDEMTPHHRQLAERFCHPARGLRADADGPRSRRLFMEG